MSNSPEGKITVFRAMDRKVNNYHVDSWTERKKESAHFVLPYSPDGKVHMESVDYCPVITGR